MVEKTAYTVRLTPQVAERVAALVYRIRALTDVPTSVGSVISTLVERGLPVLEERLGIDYEKECEARIKQTEERDAREAAASRAELDALLHPITTKTKKGGK